MSWLFLVSAILMEVAGTTFMKLSNGLSNWHYTAAMFASYIACFGLLAMSLKTIDVSIAYAIWSAVGIVLISMIGIFYFGENVNLLKVLSTLLIIAGVIGLKLSSSY